MSRSKKILLCIVIAFIIMLILALFVRHCMERFFLYGIVVLFVFALFYMGSMLRRHERSMRRLRNIAMSINGIEKHKLDAQTEELGKIITQNYARLRDSQHAVSVEREKLLQHVHSAHEGICFFSSDKEVEFCNGLFIQYLNILVDASNVVPAIIFTDKLFVGISDFLQKRKNDEWYFQTCISQHGRDFAVRINIFEDSGFEAILNDITRLRTTRQVKQEITDNIIHELRTPVTCIRGCIETVLQHALTPDKERYFIQRAYNQTIALSDLISDMTMLAKTNDAPQQFSITAVDIEHLLQTLCSDLEIPLAEKHITMAWYECKNIRINGSRTLIYAIFRNLTDNVIRYAGENVAIRICKYDEDNDYYYFSYADNGAGIADEHLPRIFDRFYRTDSGRTRDSGGSGLGLAIVKNAIEFHKGSISAKNRAGGGLEFIFTLNKR